MTKMEYLSPEQNIVCENKLGEDQAEYINKKFDFWDPEGNNEIEMNENDEIEKDAEDEDDKDAKDEMERDAEDEDEEEKEFEDERENFNPLLYLN